MVVLWWRALLVVVGASTGAACLTAGGARPSGPTALAPDLGAICRGWRHGWGRGGRRLGRRRRRCGRGPGRWSRRWSRCGVGARGGTDGATTLLLAAAYGAVRGGDVLVADGIVIVADGCEEHIAPSAPGLAAAAVVVAIGTECLGSIVAGADFVIVRDCGLDSSCLDSSCLDSGLAEGSRRDLGGRTLPFPVLWWRALLVVVGPSTGAACRAARGALPSGPTALAPDFLAVLWWGWRHGRCRGGVAAWAAWGWGRATVRERCCQQSQSRDMK